MQSCVRNEHVKKSHWQRHQFFCQVFFVFSFWFVFILQVVFLFIIWHTKPKTANFSQQTRYFSSSLDLFGSFFRPAYSWKDRPSQLNRQIETIESAHGNLTLFLFHIVFIDKAILINCHFNRFAVFCHFLLFRHFINCFHFKLITNNIYIYNISFVRSPVNSVVGSEMSLAIRWTVCEVK